MILPLPDRDFLIICTGRCKTKNTEKDKFFAGRYSEERGHARHRKAGAVEAQIRI